ncbi:MAG: DUF4292 domain-containing protein [Bacteroidetes bacterium]|nr:DUF4292 domain-containing protein [Bacteroidota bacterium]
MHKFLYIVLGSWFLFSCGGPKTVIGTSNADSGLAVKGIISAHKAAMPNFKTLASRVKVAYEDEKQRQSITVSLRMEKDKKIWMKASILGITMAKALITEDNVSYYETLGNTYFNGDFALLSNWLGTPLNFEKTQAILLGQSIFKVDNGYRSSVTNNKYKLEPKDQPYNFLHFALLNPDNFKVNSAKVSQPADNRELSVVYDTYQKVSDQWFPSVIDIEALEGDNKTKIGVTYRNIDLNVAVSFPFKIPNGYQEIVLD